MNVPKSIAIAAIVVVLGAQLVAALHPVGDWYWPFMSYGMYSVAHYATDSVPDYRLRARHCETTDAAKAGAAPLGAREVGMTVYKLREVLQATVDRATVVPVDTVSLAAQTALVDALVRHAPGNWCEVEIWERKYGNTGDVAAALRSPWHLAVRWPLGRGGGSHGWTRGDRIAPPVPPLPSLPPLSAVASSVGAQQ